MMSRTADLEPNKCSPLETLASMKIRDTTPSKEHNFESRFSRQIYISSPRGFFLDTPDLKMNSRPVISKTSDPCHKELDQFTKCVNSHTQGMKETDCETEKGNFRQCMKEVKSLNKS